MYRSIVDAFHQRKTSVSSNGENSVHSFESASIFRAAPRIMKKARENIEKKHVVGC